MAGVVIHNDSALILDKLNSERDLVFKIVLCQDHAVTPIQ